MKDILKPFPGTAAEVYIQWKGTDVCLDFHCPCGIDSHLDDSFAYSVRCVACGRTFDLGTQVLVIETDSPQSEPKDMECDPY